MRFPKTTLDKTKNLNRKKHAEPADTWSPITAVVAGRLWVPSQLGPSRVAFVLWFACARACVCVWLVLAVYSWACLVIHRQWSRKWMDAGFMNRILFSPFDVKFYTRSQFEGSRVKHMKWLILILYIICFHFKHGEAPGHHLHPSAASPAAAFKLNRPITSGLLSFSPRNFAFAGKHWTKQQLPIKQLFLSRLRSN